MENDNKNKMVTRHQSICLLERHLARAGACIKTNKTKNVVGNQMGRISVELSDKLEKKLRFKTIERFGGRKGDLSRAVQEAVETWVAKEK